ncbi:SUMF1/EgtB/PvdO family nonheme iron enzyme [Candidatus Halobeggiatoa sp. HSG11]|nr:SUMF1/EgtB/PvdO family nonheme iron enzyme [Candidatus Halobeggiatoa sp. HSG11]
MKLIFFMLLSVVMVVNAEQRVALVIGNSGYPDGEYLQNPKNDAADMAAVLRSFGFTVTHKQDLNQEQMDKAIIDFGQALRKDGVGLFYFAGHGIQIDQHNYLIPIGKRILDATKVKYRAIDAQSIVDIMGKAGSRVNIVVLDACRNNPFRSYFRSADGLAKMFAPRGTIISYATALGQKSSDGVGRNGLYTKNLLEKIKLPGLTVEEVFKQTATAVDAASGGKQLPWRSTNLIGKDFCFGICESEADRLRRKLAALERQLEERESKPVLKQVEPIKPVVKASQLTPGQTFQDRLKSGGFGPEMVVIPTGRFQMGGRYSQKYNHLTTEIPVHWVDIRYEFAMGKYEVTNAEFVQFLNVIKRRGSKEKPWFETEREDYNSHIKGSVNNFYVESNYEMHPVIEVSWYGAVAYAKWMSKQTGEEYRLPSEVEWEYAARAGTETRYWWGNDAGENKANCWNLYCNDSFKYTAPVGSFNANQFGLYDTVGNVWEWVADGWHEDYTNAPNDGRIWTVDADDSLRVQRGGSWLDSPYGSRMNNAARVQYTPNSRDSNVGFRVVRRVVARTN